VSIAKNAEDFYRLEIANLTVPVVGEENKFVN